MATSQPKEPKPPERKVGRPTMLNEELIKLFEFHLLKGNYVQTICGAMGVNQDTYYEWIKKGKIDPESIYGQFAETIERAKDQAELNMVATINDGPERWQAQMAILERSRREKWGRVSEKDEVIQPKIELNLGEMTADESIEYFKKLSETLNNAGTSDRDAGSGDSD